VASWLPDEDRTRSPFTGWTRAHWEATADHVLADVRAHTSSGGSFVKTSPDQGATAGLEGFARAGLLAGYRVASSDDAAVRDPLLSWLGRGIDVGTRPRQPDAWPVPADHHQAIVEAAWVAITLAETRADLWDQFGAGTRQQVLRWLTAVRGKAVHRNNWLLYPVVVDGFLEQVSGPTDAGATGRALRQIDAMHHRDGWYSDGAGTCFGHYSAWGVQLLLAHWMRITGGDAFPGGPQVLRERLRTFLGEYAHLVGADGGPVLHGRSLVYRFAAAAPFWLGALVDASPFTHGTTRRIASGVLRHFVVHGALRDGIPPLGWYGAFPAIADSYSTPLSPLVACDAFVGLLLAPAHPAWTDTETAGPADAPVARALATPGFVCMTSSDGLTRVASHGATAPSVSAHPGYRKVGYSNRTAPTTGPMGALDLDGQVTIVAGDGTLLGRRAFSLVAAGDRFASSTWTPQPPPPSARRRRAVALARRLPAGVRPRFLGPTPDRDERVETVSVARPDMELRVTHLWSLDGGTIRDGGLAVSHDEPPAVSRGDGWCAATTTDGLTGAVIALHGWTGAGWRTAVEASPFGRHTVVPYVDGDGGEPEALLVCAHVLTTGPVDAEAIRASSTVEVLTRRALVVRFADGEEHLVQLFRPGPLRVAVGRLELDGTYRYARWSPDGSGCALPSC